MTWKQLTLLLLTSLFLNIAESNSCKIPDKEALSVPYQAAQANENDSCLKLTTQLPADYYMLSLSYSPKFCDKQQSKGQLKDSLKFQCDSNNQFFWVVHGLWAQSNHPLDCTNQQGKNVKRYPRYCQADKVGPIPTETLAKYMCTQPGVSLLQGEWEKHGTCGSFKDADDYFAKTKALFEKLKLPETDLPAKSLFKWMKDNNKDLAGKYLEFSGNELHVCYATDWSYIDCPKQ
jgi:ribonuclease T2